MKKVCFPRKTNIMPFIFFFFVVVIQLDYRTAAFFSVNGQATIRRSSHAHGQTIMKNSGGYFTLKPHGHMLSNAHNGFKNQFEFN